MSARAIELVEVLDRGQVLGESRVDRPASTVYDVKLLGKVSKNGRTYSDRALDDAVRLYNHAPFYLDHPTEQALRASKGVRSVLDLAGEVVNPRRVADAVRGDFHVLKREPTSSLVFAIAEQMPHMAGSSHRAQGQVRATASGDVVESLTEVFGVELVTDPATTAGLFESLGVRKTPIDESQLKDYARRLGVHMR